MVPSCGCILHFFGWVPGPARFFGAEAYRQAKEKLRQSQGGFFESHIWGEIAVVNRCNFPGEFSIHDFWFLFLFKKNIQKKAGKQKNMGGILVPWVKNVEL